MSAPKTLRNVFTVGAFTMLSRVLGLVREMLQSRLIGAGMEQAAFTLAFAIPNMARKLFGEGALTAAFVPVFKGEVESDSLERASQLARAVMTMVLLMLGAIVLLLMGGLETVVHFRDALGLKDTPRLLLTIRLVKTLLPYMIFICGAAFGMGVLNALGRFKASSFMPCLLNFFWIGILAWLALSGLIHKAYPDFLPGLFTDYRLDQRIHRVAMAILIAGAAQMAFMFWCMHKAGVSPRPLFSGWRDSKVVLVWKNLGIAALGAGAIQINYMLDQLLAQLANSWAAGVIGYAERLMDLPLGVIGVAFGTVLLPTFAGLFAKGDVDGAREALSSSVVSLMFVMLPAAAGLLVLAPEITAVIYQGGAFDAVATVRVSRALAVYAAGLGFFGFQKTLVPWFHAQNDMKTPLRVSVLTVAVNAVLNILAVWLLPVEWRHVGLALSTVLCAAIGCALLVVLARRRNGSLGLRKAFGMLGAPGPLLKMLGASILMGFAVAAAKPLVAKGPAL
ncbi:MAG: murein biosynthesis integral membrane protein MurJ, partial [Kiritimatiellae bacterium]|nr:murein biosynthesis integral membrane protein MurJ [Kiritimatiellia bacterium]